MKIAFKIKGEQFNIWGKEVTLHYPNTCNKAYIPALKIKLLPDQNPLNLEDRLMAQDYCYCDDEEARVKLNVITDLKIT